MEINTVELYTVLDSRTNPTIMAEINGKKAVAPSGASTGSHEARGFVPDNIDAIETKIQSRLIGQDITQQELDQILEEIDGTSLFENIGSVAIATSLAFKHADGFNHKNVFPYPMGNVIGGGEHGGNTSIQEFLVIPTEAETFPDAVQTNADIYREMKKRYTNKIKGINDEGALITTMDDEKTLKYLKKVADDHNARLGLDVAANELWNGDTYAYPSLNMELSTQKQLTYMENLIDKYNLYSVEDPFHEDDYRSHQLLRRETDCLIIGDDLFVTTQQRLERGIEEGAGNSILIKPNQAGTITRTEQTVETAQEKNYTTVISHRSGETCDTSISDLALEWGSPFIKAGIADIRIAKLNRLTYLWEKMRRQGKQPQMAELP